MFLINGICTKELIISHLKFPPTHNNKSELAQSLENIIQLVHRYFLHPVIVGHC